MFWVTINKKRTKIWNNQETALHFRQLVIIFLRPTSMFISMTADLSIYQNTIFGRRQYQHSNTILNPK